MASWTNSFVRGAKAALSVALATATFATIQPAVAQEVAPEHLALARQYVDLTDGAQLYETTLIRTGIETMRQIITQNPEITQQTSDAIGVVIAEYVTERDELFDQFARVYAIRFTMDELTQIIAFYETPVGRKLTETNPSTNADLQRVMQVYTNNLRTEFFARVRATLRAEGVEL